MIDQGNVVVESNLVEIPVESMISTNLDTVTREDSQDLACLLALGILWELPELHSGILADQLLNLFSVTEVLEVICWVV